jgi:tetratricopeptide (TPR) repeat protein
VRWLLLVTIGLAGLAAPATARAQESAGQPALVRARAHLAAVELDLAREALDEALRAGQSGPAELAEIHLLAGRVAAALGRPADAVQHFRRLLAIDPAAVLPTGLAPKIVGPFDEARRSARVPLRLRAQLVPGAAPVLEVRVESDPLAMVAGARAVVTAAGGGDQTVAVTGGRSMTIRMPRDRAARIALAVVDSHGNRLAEASFAGGQARGDARLSAAIAPVSRTAVTSGATPARPLVARWYLWAGASALLLAGGVTFAVAADNTEEELDRWDAASGTHDATGALELDSRGRRQTLFANVGFAAAAVTAGVSAWLLWRSRRSARSPATVSGAVVDGGGAALAIGLRF